MNVENNRKQVNRFGVTLLVVTLISLLSNYGQQTFSQVFPNDQFFQNQYGLHNTGQTVGEPGSEIQGISDQDIDAPEGWQLKTDASDIIVAIIDLGVQYDHPDLAANIWTNAGEIPGNGIDDDQNGYVDDIHGWDFIDNDPDPSGSNHGTASAGVIGAVGNNSRFE
jgi:subtilisin family serine protease